jgi:glutathione S-transferase
MRYYDTPLPAPNPRRVRVFLAEKGLELPTQSVAINRGEHRSPDYLRINPLGQTPALELDEGSVLTESVAICRYLEALNPTPPLFGRTPEEIGRVEMWIRRAELRLMEPVSKVWVHTHPLTARLPITRFEAFGEDSRDRAKAALRAFDTGLESSRFLAGEEFTMADIVLLSIIDFASFIGLPLVEEGSDVARWHADVSARPSAAA